jgi:hypothetical protein
MADPRQTWRQATDAASPVNRAFAAFQRGDAGFADGTVGSLGSHVISSAAVPLDSRRSASVTSATSSRRAPG